MDFAELWPFVDLKLKNYSSGMLVRLAFAVMIQVDADILLIDEVLAVGDAAFQQKCYEEFARIRESGATVLLVTHDMGAVQRFCDRAILLERGELIESGDPERVGNRYLEVNFPKETQPTTSDEEGRFGEGGAEIFEAWFEDEHGARATTLPWGRPCTLRDARALPRAASRTRSSASCSRTRAATPCSRPTRWRTDPSPARSPPARRRRSALSFDLLFAPDRYHATPAVARAGTGIAWIDRRERFASVMVTGIRDTDGIVDLEHRITVERARDRDEVAG